MPTKPARARFALMWLLPVALVACGPATIPAASETEHALCQAWRDDLPTRSRADSPQTQAEIGVAYDAFLAACGPRGYALPF